ERGYTSQVRGGEDRLRVRACDRDAVDGADNPCGNLLELPPVFHRQAEARRYRRARRAIPAQIRHSGVASAARPLAEDQPMKGRGSRSPTPLFFCTAHLPW